MSLQRLTSRKVTLDPSSPIHVCAAHDHGAGVRLGSDTFAIYSLAPLPIICRAILEQDAVILSELTAAASQVCETLPVHVNLGRESLVHLTSLPVPHVLPKTRNLLPLPPWFLIRAAMSEKHCVVGENSAVESLLVILQRPWCILEICCCDARTISAVLSFAKLAVQIDSGIYNAAVRLLSHEQAVRNAASINRWPHQTASDASYSAVRHALPGTSVFDSLRDIYTATSINGIRSNNPFWLSLICTCAVRLNMTFATIIEIIHGCDCDPLENCVCRSRGQAYLISLYAGLIRSIGESLI